MRLVFLGLVVLFNISCAVALLPHQKIQKPIPYFNAYQYILMEYEGRPVTVATFDIEKRKNSWTSVYLKPVLQVRQIPDPFGDHKKFLKFYQDNAWLLFTYDCGRKTCAVNVYERQKVSQDTPTPLDLWLFVYNNPRLPRDNSTWRNEFLSQRYNFR